MAKTEKKTKEKAAKPEKTFDQAAEEKKLKEKYSDQHFIAGSLQDAGTNPEFGNKRSIEIVCQKHKGSCTRRVATSDLHQVKFCPDGVKEVRLERRREAREEKAADKAEKKAAKAKTKEVVQTVKQPRKRKGPEEKVHSGDGESTTAAF